LRAALALAAVSLAGCFNFNECNLDSDCARLAPDGGNPAGLFCTSDHFCVNGLPDERLCEPPLGAPLAQKPVIVAGLFRLSGAADAKDTEMADAARLAIEEVSQLNQRPIALYMCDTAGDDTHSVRAFNHALSLGAVAIVGPTTSSDLVAIAPLAAQAHVLVVSPSATSPAITDLPDRPFLWRTAASDTLQAIVLAQQAKLLAPANAMPPSVLDLAYVDSVYGVGLDQAFIAAWGMQPKSAISFPEGVDPTVPLGKLAMDKPTVSVLIADADAAALVASLSTNQPLALASTQFLMTDGAKGLDLFGAMPNVQVLSRIRGTAPGEPSGATFNAFDSTYRDKFGQSSTSTSFVANTYDAFYAVAFAIAGTPTQVPLTGDALAGVMARLSTKPNTVRVGPEDYVKGVSALLSNGAIDLDGTSGPIDFNATTGDVLSAPIEIWDIDTSVPSMPKFRTLNTVTP